MKKISDEKKETVAVVGASPLKDRYSNKAMVMLEEFGHTPVPVAPRYETIEGREVFHDLADISRPVDTVTLYVGPARQSKVVDQIISHPPRRVIFNPGTENPSAYKKLTAAGIKYQEACTLVLLKTGQFS